MSNYYFDASALVKRYINETGSQWLRALFSDREASFFVAHVAIVEVISAFTRRMREDIITPVEYQELLAAFRMHCVRDYRLITAVGNVIDSTNYVLERYLLRALDAIHLSAALIVNQQLLASHLSPLTFLCADDRLLAAAAAEGLAVDNPNAYP